jgi:hypothetical protein
MTGPYTQLPTDGGQTAGATRTRRDWVRLNATAVDPAGFGLTPPAGLPANPWPLSTPDLGPQASLIGYTCIIQLWSVLLEHEGIRNGFRADVHRWVITSTSATPCHAFLYAGTIAPENLREYSPHAQQDSITTEFSLQQSESALVVVVAAGRETGTNTFGDPIVPPSFASMLEYDLVTTSAYG